MSASVFAMHVNKTNTPWPPTVGVDFSMLRLHDSGVEWSMVNTKAGTYDWSRLDTWLSKAALYGNPVMYDFYKTPSWASSKPSGSCLGGNDGGCYPPSDLNADGTGTDQHVKDFIAALMKHVGPGKFKYIEIWNEFNNSIEWNGTMAQLVRITKDVRAIAKAYDPNILISSPAETGDWSATCCSLNMKWLGKFLAAGGGPYVDAIGLHGHVTHPEDIIARTNSALAIMAQYGQSGKPLFDTEGSWPIDKGLSASLQRGFLFREYLATLSTPTKKFFLYAYDVKDAANLWNYTTDQITVNGTAYKLWYSWLAGSTMTSKCQPQVAGSSSWSCTFTMSDGTKAMAIWNTAVTYPNTLNVTVPSIYLNYKTLDGATHSINATHVLPIGYEPIWLEN